MTRELHYIVDSATGTPDNTYDFRLP